MNITLLRGFNNYFNRRAKTVRGMDTLSGYVSYAQENNVDYLTLTKINFNPADGVDTTIVLNYNDDFEPDYLICSEDDVVLSRWYVMDTNRTRSQQYSMQLHRDVVVDNYNTVLNSPLFIEKAMLKSTDNMIFNDEGASLNQIKKSERILQDGTKCAWIVGYVAHGSSDEPAQRWPSDSSKYYTIYTGKSGASEYETLPTSIKTMLEGTNTATFDCTDPSAPVRFSFNNQYYVGRTNKTLVNERLNVLQSYNNFPSYGLGRLQKRDQYDIPYNINQPYLKSEFNNILTPLFIFPNTDTYTVKTIDEITRLYIQAVNTNKEYINSLFNGNYNYTYNDYVQLSRYRNKVVKKTEGDVVRYYKVIVNEVITSTGYALSNSGASPNISLFTGLVNVARGINPEILNQDIGSVEGEQPVVFNYLRNTAIITVRLEEVAGGEDALVKTYIPANRRTLHSEPFDMFCIPYAASYIDYDGVTQTMKLPTGLGVNYTYATPDAALATARALALAGSSAQSVVYDIQVLPYCPLPSSMYTTTSTGCSFNQLGTIDYDINYATDENNRRVAIIFWCRENSFELDIEGTYDFRRETEIIDVKYGNNLYELEASKDYIARSNSGRQVHMSQPVSPYISPLYELKWYELTSATTEGNCEISNIIYDTETRRVEADLLLLDDVDQIRKEWEERYPPDDPNYEPFPGISFGATVTLNANYGIMKRIPQFKNPLSLDIKVKNETQIFRLCSPNMSSIYAFKPLKGVNWQNYSESKVLFDGTLQDQESSIIKTTYHVDCTYRPFNPYIHIVPQFEEGSIYNKTFHDLRGLVLSGDFSLSIVTSAWETYQLQNKNFEAAFNREIQNMDTQNQLGIASQVINSAVGSIIGGVGTGLKTGNVLAGVAAGAGTVLSTGLNIGLNQAKYAENRDYKIDMYNYQLGNVKALPVALTKTSALNLNNKLFPILESYECTEEEKAAMINKIKYNGMTVSRIGTIGEIMILGEQFIKGQLIRVVDSMDNHMAQSLYDELNKGIYLIGGEY